MFEELLIGFLLGILSCVPVFPEKQSFWRLIWNRLPGKA